jgi:hypothetical protein
MDSADAPILRRKILAGAAPLTGFDGAGGSGCQPVIGNYYSVISIIRAQRRFQGGSQNLAKIVTENCPRFSPITNHRSPRRQPPRPTTQTRTPSFCSVVARSRISGGSSPICATEPSPSRSTPIASNAASVAIRCAWSSSALSLFWPLAIMVTAPGLTST